MFQIQLMILSPNTINQRKKMKLFQITKPIIMIPLQTIKLTQTTKLTRIKHSTMDLIQIKQIIPLQATKPIIMIPLQTIKLIGMKHTTMDLTTPLQTMILIGTTKLTRMKHKETNLILLLICKLKAAKYLQFRSED